MLLKADYMRRFARGYLAVFLLCACWYVFHGVTLTQGAPISFSNRADLTLNLIFATGVQHAIIKYVWLRVILDLAFVASPVLLVFVFLRHKKYLSVLALFTSVYQLFYTLVFCAMLPVSVEVFIPWVVLPLLLSSHEPGKFYFRFHAARLLFLMFFVSAALWKLRTGALLHREQFSAILLMQHASYLTAPGDDLYGRILYFLIDHPAFARIIYVIAFLIEISFATGFFTKRFDRVLLVLLILFVVFDYFLMAINYTPWLAFGLLLYHSDNKYSAAAFVPRQKAVPEIQ